MLSTATRTRRRVRAPTATDQPAERVDPPDLREGLLPRRGDRSFAQLPVAPHAAAAIASSAAAGATALVWAADRPTSDLKLWVLCALTLGGGSVVARRRLVVATFLPLMGSLIDVVGPVLGLLALQAMLVLADQPGLSPAEASAAGSAACLGLLGARFLRRRGRERPRCRVAVIGSSRIAHQLRKEVAAQGVGTHTIVGWVDPSSTFPPSDEAIGQVGALREVAERYRVDLFVLTESAPRMTVLDELGTLCQERDIRLLQFAAFHEEVFGQVPLSGLSGAWFQHVLHPRYRGRSRTGKRAMDVSLAVVMGVLLLPALLIAALVIRRDGGPAFFRQRRIGEGGRAFEVLKLRTMDHRSDGPARWSAADDSRVTRAGRFLRRTHLDEVPQLLNVLRGEMSLVGPRPEQPMYVEQLEALLPFYQRRHLVRPGITGWAQVRCGYSGSEMGSAWKLSHDLYYLKHSSLILDLVILSETLRTLVADNQYGVEPAQVACLLDEA